MQDLMEQNLTKEQMDLVGKGYAGPPVLLGTNSLKEAQVLLSFVPGCPLVAPEVTENAAVRGNQLFHQLLNRPFKPMCSEKGVDFYVG